MFAGMRFGALLTIAEVPGKRRRWEVICDCDQRKVVDATNLWNGHVQSCGCRFRNYIKTKRKDHLECTPLFSPEDADLLSLRWILGTHGYAHCNRKLAHHMVLIRMLGRKPDHDKRECTDHKNRNRLDNRRENLHIISRSENNRNRSPRRKKLSPPTTHTPETTTMPTPYDTPDSYATNPQIPDFGFDPNEVQTDYAVILPGVYRATVSKAEVKTKDDGSPQIKVFFQIDDEVKSEDGALIPGGFHKLVKTYSTSEKARPFLLRLHDAVHGSKKGTRPVIEPSLWEGKQILLEVQVDPERTDPVTGHEYSRSNSVKNTMFLRQ